jgi:hypothetical protein
MTLFVLLASMAWMHWTTSQKGFWLACSFGCYVVSMLSKETAFLLPVMLWLGAPRLMRRDGRILTGLALMFAGASAALALRMSTGAIMPDTADAHYGLIRPAARWIRNLQNYTGRALPSPLGLLLLAGIPALLTPQSTRRPALDGIGRQFAFALSWFVVFLIPVLPIVARSELYLYLPSVGLCLLAGFAVDAMIDRQRISRIAFASLAAYAVLFGAYQFVRIRALSDDLQFSARLTREIAGTLEGYNGTVVIVPADASTAQFMADSIGGYGDLALKMATGRYEVNGAIGSAAVAESERARRLVCLYRNGRVQLTAP